MRNLILYINKIRMLFKKIRINYFLIFLVFSLHLPKVHCQESYVQNQSFEAKITIPFFVQKTHTRKVLKGKTQPDKITKIPNSSLRYIINAKTISAKIANNTITAHYENFDGKEKIDFSGTISKDKKMLLKLGINYSYIIKGNPAEIRKGKFYIYNVPLKKMDKNLFKDLYRIKYLAENEEIFTGNYDKDTTTIEVESFHSLKQYSGNHRSETWTETLFGDDPDYFKKVLLAGWRITFTSSEDREAQGVVMKGNSTSYAGYLIAGLLKHQEIQIFDQTDEVNKVRGVEASMKDICQPPHRELALQIEENLKQPREGEVTVTINETHNLSPQGIDTVVMIKGLRRGKELKYSLSFGKSKSELVQCDQTFFSQIDEIVDAILKFR